MGGLTTAAILARMKNKRVLVLERHYRAGGFTHTFKRPGGFRWDVGLHYVGEMGEGSRSRMLIDYITGGVNWNALPDVYDRFLYPGTIFDVPTGAAAYRASLIEKFPGEEAAIKKYFRDIAKATSFATRTIIAGSMPVFLFQLIRLANRLTGHLPLTTTSEYLKANFKDPLLKALLASQWMDYGLPPAQSAFVTHALIVNHYLSGAWYPQGGSGVIAEGAQKIIEQFGGKILINHEVAQIVVENGQAVGVDARLVNKADSPVMRFNAPVIISDVGAWNTFERLLPPETNIPFRKEMNDMVSSEHPGPTMVTLYLGLDRDPSCMGFHGENYWIFDGLDHDAMVSQQDELLEGKAHVCYLSFPSLKEKDSKAHTAEIIAPLSYSVVERFRNEPWRRRSDEYEDLKESMSRAMLDAVDHRFPGFSKMVVFSELSTPLTVEHFTGHLGGTVYGIPATPERYRQPWLKPDTPVKGLFLTGADAGSLGIMGALMGGVSAAARVVGPFGLFSVIAAATKAKMQAAARQVS